MTYITPSKAFAHLDRLHAWKHGKHPAPVTVEWDLSNRCTLGCMDCHFAHTHVKGPWASQPRTLPMAYSGTGDLADPALVCRALSEMARVGVKGIIWSGGGEPTTHPDWQTIVTYAADLGLEQGMYTLGGLLTRDSATLLSQRATWVVVSLDAADAQTYADEKGVPPDRFDRACDGVTFLSSRKATIGVSFLLHERNWTRMEDMRQLAHELGANYTTFRPTIRTSPDRPGVCLDDRLWVRDAMPTLRRYADMRGVECDPNRFQQYADWQGHGYSTCHGIKLTCTITPDGRIWVCPQHRGIEGSCVGDLRTQSFSDAWDEYSGTYAVGEHCRVMCRLHLINQHLAPIFKEYPHSAFV